MSFDPGTERRIPAPRSAQAIIRMTTKEVAGSPSATPHDFSHGECYVSISLLLSEGNHEVGIQTGTFSFLLLSPTGIFLRPQLLDGATQAQGSAAAANVSRARAHREPRSSACGLSSAEQ